MQHLLAVALRNGKTIPYQDELCRAIQALTAEDFRRLLAEPGAWKALVEKLDAQMMGIFKRSFALGLVRRWLEVAPEEATTRVAEVLKAIPAGSDMRGCLIDALAKQRPEVLLAIADSSKDTKERGNFIAKALAELAAQHLTKARAWLDRLPEGTDRKEAEKAIRKGMVQADPMRVVELAGLDINRSEASELLVAAANRAEEMGVGMLRQLATASMPDWCRSDVLFTLTFSDPEMTIDLAKSIQNSSVEVTEPLRNAFSALARTDRAHALERMEGLTGKNLTAAVGAIGAEWVASEPVAALDWLASRPEEERIENPSSFAPLDCLKTVFGRWVKQEPAAARAWADALPAGKTRDTVQRQLASSLADLGQPAEATKILASMGDAVDPKAVRDVALIWAQRDPHAAAEWAIAQPDGAMQTQALAAVVGAWANNDSRETQAWLAQFPAGEARDKCVVAFLRRESSWAMDVKQSFAEFDAWFDLIEDPWQRTQAAERRYWSAEKSDPAGARAWLSSLRNVDPERIRMTLRKP